MDKKAKLRDRLEKGEQAVLALLESVDDGVAAAAVANSAWSAKDLVAHLAAAELGHQEVIRRLLAGESTHIPGFDLDAYNNADIAARQGLSLTELIAEYKANRASTLALLDTVGDDDWDKAGPHPGGFDTTVEGTFRVIAIHEKRHLKELNTAL